MQPIEFTPEQLEDYSLTQLKNAIATGTLSARASGCGITTSECKISSKKPWDKMKMLATLGPSSCTTEVITEMLRAGLDAVRLNFSHGDPTTHSKLFACVQEAMKASGRQVTVIGDIQGPKLRIGNFGTPDSAILLKVGDDFLLDSVDQPGDQKRVYLPHPEFFDVVEAGDDILLNDGYVRLVCTKIDRKARMMHTRVTISGKLSNHKGITVPTRILPLCGLSEKDKRDITNACLMGVDFIALSFVQTAADVTEAKEFIAGLNRANPKSHVPKIVSKIEKPTAVLEIDEIARLSDMIMVARGDLAIETCLSKVNAMQKYIIARSREMGSFVIVATQVVESMITNYTPNLAEVNDIASACFDGAHVTMVSAESAAGVDPVNVVRVMKSVLKVTELSDEYAKRVTGRDHFIKQRSEESHKGPDAVALGAITLADQLHAKALVVFSETGGSIVRLVRQRCAVPMLCVTRSKRVVSWMNIVWNTRGVYYEKQANTIEDLTSIAEKVAMEQDLAKPGDSIVLVFGAPFGQAERKGCNNLLAHTVCGGAGRV